MNHLLDSFDNASSSSSLYYNLLSKLSRLLSFLRFSTQTEFSAVQSGGLTKRKLNFIQPLTLLKSRHVKNCNVEFMGELPKTAIYLASKERGHVLHAMVK